MTISEFHLEFKVGLDKVVSLNSPSFLPEEIDVLLNNSIEKFISQRMYGMNPRREGFEETQKRWDDLITLVNQQNYNTFFSSPFTKPNGQTVAFPVDYWHTIEEDATISFTDCNGQTQTKSVPVIPVTHDRYNKIIRDPFHKPNENKVVRLGIGGSPELIVGTGVTLSNYFLRYVRKPDKVQFGSTYAVPTADVQCNLPEHTHKEIVAMAVQEALGNIESQRVQIKAQENLVIE
jgi:hypothetical protein